MNPELPITLRTSLRMNLLLLAGSLLFIAAGVWLLGERPLIGWASIVFFGLCAVVFVLQLLPNAAYLQITDEGIIYCALFRRHFIPWGDMADFGVTSIARRIVVGFNHAPSYAKQPRLRALNKRTIGYEAALPECYGLPAEELAALLSYWHQRCTSSGVPRQ